MCQASRTCSGLFFSTRILRSNAEKVFNHFKIIGLLFIWVNYIEKAVKRIKVDVDFRFDKNLLELIERNQSILIVVDIVEQKLNIVNLKQDEKQTGEYERPTSSALSSLSTTAISLEQWKSHLSKPREYANLRSKKNQQMGNYNGQHDSDHRRRMTNPAQPARIDRAIRDCCSKILTHYYQVTRLAIIIMV